MRFLHPVLFLVFSVLSTYGWAASPTEEDDSRFKAVALSGAVTVYRDERDETARFRVGDTTDEGDNVSTGAQSEVLLRLSGKAYVHLGSHTKVHISRLRNGDKGPQVRLNLLTGHLWCQLDQAPRALFEVSAKSLIVRCHGTLFEVLRQKDAVRVMAYEGAVVTVSHGQTKIAKEGELVQYANDQFRYKHHLQGSDEDRLTQWKARLLKLQALKPH